MLDLPHIFFFSDYSTGENVFSFHDFPTVSNIFSFMISPAGLKVCPVAISQGGGAWRKDRCKVRLSLKFWLSAPVFGDV